jgi:3'-phosphoadenosine 5'-phosphosulfate (PAPS) 3'-phosphatase
MDSMAALRELDRLADAFADMASTAGRAILDIYDTPFTAREKSDRSPVTDPAAGRARRSRGGLRGR